MNVKMYSLIAVDLDGTLLSTHKKITERTIEALKKVHQQGVVIVLCTGRSAINTFTIESQIPVPVFTVCCDGAIAYHPNSKQSEFSSSRTVLFKNEFSAKQRDRIVAIANELSLCIVQYEAYSAKLKVKINSKEQKELADAFQVLSFGAEYEHVEIDIRALEVLPVKLCLLTNDSDAVGRDLRGRLDDVNVYPETGHVGCVPKPVDKGTSLTKLCGILGISMEQVVSIGDGHNDVTMIKCSGKGIAMKNAVETLKEASNLVTEFTNDEDGVARLLEEFLSMGLFGKVKLG
ncbi:HAD-like domain-containing protein [Obelidium mucronatum]|nr:HAD-like domain-containing protein [Obelidium mucronatum]